ncbi:sec14 [Symbiodinium sp. CCMP2456]|nr:sec14 [Symbiodinium sp. CCMP2456]
MAPLPRLKSRFCCLALAFTASSLLSQRDSETVLLRGLPWRLIPRLFPSEPTEPGRLQPAVASSGSSDRFLLAGVPREEVRRVAELTAEVAALGEEPLADPLTLLRFLRARHGNVPAAAHMYRDTLAWRSSFCISSVMNAFGSGGEYHRDGARATDTSKWTWAPSPSTPESRMAARHAFWGRLLAPDMEEPVLIWRAGSADYEGMVREGIVDLMIEAFVAHLEDAFQAVRACSLKSKKLLKARVIIDCKGFGFENVRYIPILRKIIVMATSYFPEISASVTVVRAPSFLATFYGLVRPLLPKMLQDKVSILGNNFEKGLYERTGLEMDSWPTFLGGTVDCVEEVQRVPRKAWSLLKSESLAYA